MFQLSKVLLDWPAMAKRSSAAKAKTVMIEERVVCV